MAKKKASAENFKMAAAIRSFSGREAQAAIEQKYPGQKINQNSFNVAFYNARNALGIKSGRRRKVVRVVKPGAAPKRSGGAINMELLAAAREMLNAAGSADKAVAAIKQLQALQIG